MRTFDENLVRYGLDTYDADIKGLNVSEWLANHENIALANEDGDIALFERQFRAPFSVCGHYFFHSRGKKAIEAAEAFLEELFSNDYGVEVILGLTPIDHKAALWMNRRLGFREQEVVDTETGPHRFVILTKEEWLQKRGKTE